jgi:hypothetical protein
MGEVSALLMIMSSCEFGEFKGFLFGLLEVSVRISCNTDVWGIGKLMMEIRWNWEKMSRWKWRILHAGFMVTSACR